MTTTVNLNISVKTNADEAISSIPFEVFMNLQDNEESLVYSF
jgi:hypothetical protein